MATRAPIRPPAPRVEEPLRPASAPAVTYERRRTGRAPKGDLISGSMREYGRDPLATMLRWRDEFGDFVPIRFGPFRAHMAFGPAEIEELLIERYADFRKSFGTQMLIPILGHGLLTAEGDEWQRHRRLAAPGFHRERINAYGRTMTELAAQHAEGWRDGQPIDVHREMTALTLRIVARTLFDTDVTARIEEVARFGTEIQDFYFDRFASLRFLLPTWVPTPGNLRLRRAIRRLDEVVFGIIDERRPDEDRGDVLSMLLLARDAHGERLTRRQVRDEVMTLFLAGHETTALTLTWAWLLLDGAPEVRARLATELRTELRGRAATPDDVPALPYTEAVINETLRLYPPAYITGRQAIRETSLAGERIPPRHTVLASIATLHRDPRFFPEPNAFRPERWLDGLDKRLPRGAFVPFGLGPRKCIGASFAMLEAVVLLATLAARWQVSLGPGRVLPHPAITLRPAGPVEATVSRAA